MGNTLVCLVILLNRNLQTPINYLLLNLAVADIIAIAFTSPQYIFIHMFTHPKRLAGDFLCKFITGGNISWMGGVASVFSVVAISFDRYQAVTKPTIQRSKFSLFNVKAIVACCWIFSVAFNLPLFFVMFYDKKANFCHEDWPSAVYGQVNSTVWFLVVGIIPWSIMFSLYSRLVYDLWFKKTNESTQVAVRNSRKKVTKIVITVSFINIIGWCPQLTLYVLSNYQPEHFQFGSTSYVASVIMVTFNSVVNPLIYSFQSQRFRQCFKQLLYFSRCNRAERVFPSNILVLRASKTGSSNWQRRRRITMITPNKTTTVGETGIVLGEMVSLDIGVLE